MKLQYNDREHAYWLDGKRCKSVTQVAKVFDNNFALTRWLQRQVAIGMAQSVDLVEAVAAHVEDPKKLDELADEAREVAGANRAARRGTAAHRITELVDQGKEVVPTELSRSIMTTWTASINAAGLTVIPELMERIVVYPDRRICGRFDRGMRRADGELVIVDLKSGQQALRHPHAIALQLALYVNAPFMAGDLPAEGGVTDLFEPLPDFNREEGYVVHLPEHGDPMVAVFDLKKAWEMIEECAWRVLDWRDRKDLIIEVIPVTKF